MHMCCPWKNIMPTSLSLPIPPSIICSSRDSSRDLTRSSISQWNNKESQHVSDLKLSKRKLLLYTTTSLGLCSRHARAEPESPDASISNRISYSRFLKHLDEGDVKKVDLFENGTVAIAEIYNRSLDKIQRVKVQLLPGPPQGLLAKMEDTNVDVAAHPVQLNWWLPLFDFLANFGFPLLLLASLFFRTSTNNPAGPNLPFGLSRYDPISKSYFFLCHQFKGTHMHKHTNIQVNVLYIQVLECV